MARTWLVTGCSSGFGRALAEAVLDAGDDLLATARDPATLKGLGAGRPGRLMTAPLDVTDERQAIAAIHATIAVFGSLLSEGFGQR